MAEMSEDYVKVLGNLLWAYAKVGCQKVLAPVPKVVTDGGLFYIVFISPWGSFFRTHGTYQQHMNTVEYIRKSRQE